MSQLSLLAMVTQTVVGAMSQAASGLTAENAAMVPATHMAKQPGLSQCPELASKTSYAFASVSAGGSSGLHLPLLHSLSLSTLM